MGTHAKKRAIEPLAQPFPLIIVFPLEAGRIGLAKPGPPTGDIERWTSLAK